MGSKQSKNQQFIIPRDDYAQYFNQMQNKEKFENLVEPQRPRRINLQFRKKDEVEQFNNYLDQKVLYERTRQRKKEKFSHRGNVNNLKRNTQHEQQFNPIEYNLTSCGKLDTITNMGDMGLITEIDGYMYEYEPNH